MSAWAPALGLTMCFLVGLTGFRMARRPPDAARRFADHEVLRPRRASLIARVSDRVGRRWGPRVLAGLSDRRRDLVQHRLDAAGGSMGMEGYAAQKASQLALFGAGGFLLWVVGGSWIALPALAYFGWLSVDLRLARQAKRRQAEIDADLPDFLDILAVVVGAGANFRQGLARVAEAVGGPVGDEIVLTLRQMDVGASRRSAFEALRARNDSEPLSKLVTALLQAEELGSPLTAVLGDIALDMRRDFQQRARRRAAEATPRVGLLVTTVVLPGAMILIVTALIVSSGSMGLFP